MEIPVSMKVRPISEGIWEISPEEKPGMRVPARIYASETLLAGMDAGVFEQVTNVACLPGIVRASLCMPDGHWGYGFPIGGVAAFRADTGVISPGGIGFDINCGMRVLRTSLAEAEVRPHSSPSSMPSSRRSPPASVGMAFSISRPRRSAR